MKERVFLSTHVWAAVQMMWCITALARLTTTHLEVRSVLHGWRQAEWKDVLVIERRALLVPRAVLRDGTKLPLFGVRWRRGTPHGEPDLTTAQGLAACARRCVAARYLTTG